MQELGHLIKVPIRDFWSDEALVFTPWLAQEENIIRLGEAIGIDLEIEAQEKSVGRFRADILCKDTITDSWVLIENQLERTDHSHLGQLLTYAAGLDIVTVIWIAERFTDEHRAALDWLNEITDEDFSFFGLEIELWRIGDSLMAPKFNMISYPNDRTRIGSKVAPNNELSDTKQLYLEYWTGVRDIIEECDGSINPVKPLAQSWQNFAIGRAGFHLRASISAQAKRIGVRLVINDADADIYFALLEQDKDNIEREMNTELEWREKSDWKARFIAVSLNDVDPNNRESWGGNVSGSVINSISFIKSSLLESKHLILMIISQRKINKEGYDDFANDNNPDAIYYRLWR